MTKESSYERASDDELANMLASGQTEALSEILLRFGSLVMYRLKKRFGSSLDESDLEDVLATALIKLWRSRLRLSQSTNHHLQQWFYLIARNTAIDLARKRAREEASYRKASGSRDKEEWERDLLHEDPIIGSLQSKQLARLHELIRELPARDQTILHGYISATGDYPWAAGIANELGMTENAVRVRLSRILTRLRERANALSSEQL